MVKKKWLMNWVIGKANKKKELKDLLEQSLSSKEAQEELKSTWKLLKLLLHLKTNLMTYFQSLLKMLKITQTD